MRNSLSLPTSPGVEVFKTNVQNKLLSELLVSTLLTYFPEYGINFDLEDCDKILRVEGDEVDTEKIILILQEHICECSVLED